MKKINIPDDFKDFIIFLNKNKVNYMLVGGWAVTIHGNPRLTGDIDFLISSEDNNIEKLKKTLEDFSAPSFNFERFKEEEESFIRMGISPTQIDIIKKATGIVAEECLKRKEIVDIDGLKINVISIDDLIANKRAAGRDKDILDVNKLEKIKNIINDKKLEKKDSNSGSAGGRK